jgi:hypothetical protein
MLAFARRVFVALLLLAVAAPVWGADLQIGDLRLGGLSADALSLVGAALLLSRAITGAADTASALVGRLERLAPVVRVELVEPGEPSAPPPGADGQPMPARPRPFLRLIGLGAGVSGCLSGADVSDTAPSPEGLAIAVGCQNEPREWGVTWQTGEDLGWIELFAETPSSSSATTITDPCGLWLTGLSCDEPVAALGRLYQRLSDVEACAQTTNDGSTPYGASCPATFDAILCE